MVSGEDDDEDDNGEDGRFMTKRIISSLIFTEKNFFLSEKYTFCKIHPLNVCNEQVEIANI